MTVQLTDHEAKALRAALHYMKLLHSGKRFSYPTGDVRDLRFAAAWHRVEKKLAKR